MGVAGGHCGVVFAGRSSGQGLRVEVVGWSCRLELRVGVVGRNYGWVLQVGITVLSRGKA